jgi:hypothetical protein
MWYHELSAGYRNKIFREVADEKCRVAAMTFVMMRLPS